MIDKMKGPESRIFLETTFVSGFRELLFPRLHSTQEIVNRSYRQSPIPIAEAIRFVVPRRQSPAANTPGRVVSFFRAFVEQFFGKWASPHGSKFAEQLVATMTPEARHSQKNSKVRDGKGKR
jgi:hypothetical protein